MVCQMMSKLKSRTGSWYIFLSSSANPNRAPKILGTTGSTPLIASNYWGQGSQMEPAMPSSCSIKMWSSRSSSDFTFNKFKILLGPSAIGLTKPTKFCTSLCQADCGSTRLEFPAKSLAKSHGIVESSDDSQRSSKLDMRIKNRFDKSWSFLSAAVQAISTASATSNLLRQPNDRSFPA